MARLLLFNKPYDVLSQFTDRSTGADRRPLSDYIDVPRVYPAGRLDRDSEGLIFLTNDGDFTLRLTHPRYGVRKCYRAIVEGRVEPVMLRRFTSGIEHEGETLKAERARIVDANNSHSIVELELAEGKNREIRRLFLVKV